MKEQIEGINALKREDLLNNKINDFHKLVM